MLGLRELSNEGVGGVREDADDEYDSSDADELSLLGEVDSEGSES